jgi:hypothetical protein
VGELLVASLWWLGIESPMALRGWGVFNVNADVTADSMKLSEIMRDPASKVAFHKYLSDLRPRDPSVYDVFLFAAPRLGGAYPGVLFHELFG